METPSKDLIINLEDLFTPKLLLLLIDDKKNKAEENIKWEEILKATSLIKEKLSANGYVVLKNLNSLIINQQQRDLCFLCFCKLFGNPAEHTHSKGDFIWPITPKATTNYAPTFSEHNLEVKLHTDSQYSPVPEKYVCFFVIRNAKDGGGKTLLLNFKTVLEELNRTAEGKTCIGILKKDFPILIPPVFRKNIHFNEYISAPIIAGDPLIRYRFDTIYDGLLNAEQLEDKEDKLWALSFLDTKIENSSNKINCALNEGDVILIDNHLVLHGRTLFEDKERLLLRIRMN